MLAVLRWLGLGFFGLYLLPILIAVALWWVGGRNVDWWAADKSSAGLLPSPPRPEAAVRIFAARTVSWRGIFATHCWIVIKDRAARRYERYDYTAWGEPIRVNGFEADGRWFGALPETVFALDGPAAEAMVPKIRAAIEAYAWNRRGDYRAWPGPNSNSFVAWVVAQVPEMRAALPSTAIGKDYPVDGSWVGRTPSGTGLRMTLGGYAGVTLGWAEGFELNILGAVAGLDWARPGIKLPALGRFGF